METQQIPASDRILQLIRLRGPILPVHASKAIGSNILMASAHLSDLSSRGQVIVSNIKVGGSPLYYLPGQEPRLQEFADNLHEKERKIFDLLRQKKVLKEADLDTVFKVAIRQIKDFAVPLEVVHKDAKEIFWKWYLLSNKEVEPLIRDMLAPQETQAKAEEERQVKEKEPIQEDRIKEAVKKPKELQKEIPKQGLQELQKEIPTESPKETPKAEKPKEIKRVRTETANEDLFYTRLSSYFNKNKIVVVEKEMIKKGSEMEFIVTIPSAVGDLKYFCKARAKKRITDSDISNAFIKGQLKKLPVLFLTDGELTKKGKEALEKDFKIHFKKI